MTIKANGGDVRIVYSPLDSLKIAEENPHKEVVFFAVGFCTAAGISIRGDPEVEPSPCDPGIDLNTKLKKCVGKTKSFQKTRLYAFLLQGSTSLGVVPNFQPVLNEVHRFTEK